MGRSRDNLKNANAKPLGLLFALNAFVCLTAASAHADVSVRANQLVRDGRPWTPHGVVQIAFVAPPAAQSGVFAKAYSHYSAASYEAMRALGLDSVRIQMSQPGLDPQDPKFDAAFRRRLIEAVRAARAAGLVVILSVQDEAQSGETHVAALPSEATRRVWASIAPEFIHDDGVMFELLNEPSLPPNPQNWRAWALAMNETIGTVRRTGAHNVVVADGLLFAERLGGAPDLSDPLGQVVYAAHPYAHDKDSQSEPSWDAKFGDFARRHPVIVTEWATAPNYYCDLGTPAYAGAFLSYLHAHRVGITIYGWDFAGAKFGSAFHGFPPQPTDFIGKRCGDDGFGPGRMFLRDGGASPSSDDPILPGHTLVGRPRPYGR